MNPEASRKIACDRCRGQKLRCVRQSDTPGVPCDRCRKADAECINTLYQKRGDLGGNGTRASGTIQNDSSPLSSQRQPSTSYASTSLGEGSSHMAIDVSRFLQSHRRDSSPQGSSKPFKRPCLRPVYGQRLSHDLTCGNDMVLSQGDTGLVFPDLNGSQNLPDEPDGNGPELEYAPFEAWAPAENLRHSDNRASSMLNAFENVQTSQISLQSLRDGSTSTLHPGPACLQYLAELFPRIVKNAHYYGTNCKTLDDILIFHGASQSDKYPQNAVGCVLENSEAFLTVLSTLSDFLSQQEDDPEPQMGSECSYSELWDINDFALSSADDSVDSGDIPSALANAETTNTGPSCRRLSKTGLEHTDTSHSLDAASTLLVLTCYSWLLETYDIIFSRIEKGLRADMPSIIPGLTVGGFSLDKRKDLQVGVFIELSTNMMVRIENVLGLGEDRTLSQPTENVLLNRTNASQVITDTILAGEGGVATRVRQTIKRIQGALRNTLK